MTNAEYLHDVRNSVFDFEVKGPCRPRVEWNEFLYNKRNLSPMASTSVLEKSSEFVVV